MKNFSKNRPVRLRKIIFPLLVLLIFNCPGFSQAGISPGASVPNSSAGLDVNFTTMGLLIPRVALTSTTSFLPLAAHIAGMIVYNTATAADVVPGLYFNNGTRWVPSLPKANTASDMQYWDGTSWIAIPVGQPGQMLQINSNGIPSWTGAGFAVIATTAVSAITATTASCGATISGDGGTPVTARGVCWSTSPNPTIAGTKTVDGSGTGTFISSITGLATGTVYYVRSYATNTTGTSYGNQFVFSTL